MKIRASYRLGKYVTLNNQSIMHTYLLFILD